MAVKILKTEAPGRDRGPSARTAAADRKTRRRAKEHTWVSASGRVVTEADADRMASEAEASDVDLSTTRRRPVSGRPGLSDGQSGESPRLTVRVDGETYLALKLKAERDHRNVSELARDAITAYLR